MNALARNDVVNIQCLGKNTIGKVILASKNGKSLMLQFEAIIAHHVGLMPVMLDDTGTYRSLINDVPVSLTKSEIDS